MIRKLLLSGFGACLLAFGGVGQAAPIQLYDFALNLDGTISDIVLTYEELDPVPAEADLSGFDYVGDASDPATGLGSIVITIMGAGVHNILAYFDHELDEDINGFDNEFGGTGGAAAAGQSWEIDEPGFSFGNLFDNFADNTLENVNDLPSPDADDIAMAMGWNFTLAADETAEIVFTISENQPGGFWLSQTDNDSDTQIFLTSTLTISGPPTGVPEPGTLLLFGAGLMGLGLARTRRRKLTDS